MEYESNIYDFELNNFFENKKVADKSIKINEKIINKYNNLLFKSIRNFSEIADIELKINEQIRIITNKNMNAISLIALYTKKYIFTEMYIAVYRMNSFTAKWLINFIKANENTNVNIIISNFFRANKNYQQWAEYIYNSSLENKNLNAKFVNNHAKIFLGQTKCNKHIVFEGSGNLSDNARIEQYMLEDNQEVYNFHKSWMLKILCKTI